MSETRRLGIYKKVSLEKVGDGWEDCYLIFKPFRFEHLESLLTYLGVGEKDEEIKLTNEQKITASRDIVKSLKELFVDGVVLDDKGDKMPAIATDVDDLFLTCGTDIINGMYSKQDPKLQKESTT